jgi:FKBP-type peptidyl-prolyl cis-trans isomerase
MPVEIVGDIHFTGEEAAERIGCVGDGDDIGRRSFLRRMKSAIFGRKKRKKKARKAMKRQQAQAQQEAQVAPEGQQPHDASTAPESAENEETESGYQTLDSEVFDRSHHDVWKRHVIVGGRRL